VRQDDRAVPDRRRDPAAIRNDPFRRRAGRSIRLDKLFALRRRLGMLFQFGALFTDFRYRQRGFSAERAHKISRNRMIRDIVLMKLNRWACVARLALRIARGQRRHGRRIALARAIALDPELIMSRRTVCGAGSDLWPSQPT